MLVPDSTSAAALTYLLGDARTDTTWDRGLSGWANPGIDRLWFGPVDRMTVHGLRLHRRGTFHMRSSVRFNRWWSGDQVGGQSDTTVCKTVNASPVTRAVIGSPLGMTKQDLRARVAWQEWSKPPR